MARLDRRDHGCACDIGNFWIGFHSTRTVLVPLKAVTLTRIQGGEGKGLKAPFARGSAAWVWVQHLQPGAGQLSNLSQSQSSIFLAATTAFAMMRLQMSNLSSWA